MKEQGDPWAKVERLRGEGKVWIEWVDAARATVERQHAAALAEKDAQIAGLQAGQTAGVDLRCWKCGTAAYQPNERCDSHISWRDRTQTEIEHRNAWQKRAEQAEAALATLRAQVDRIKELLLQTAAPTAADGSWDSVSAVQWLIEQHDASLATVEPEPTTTCRCLAGK